MFSTLLFPPLPAAVMTVTTEFVYFLFQFNGRSQRCVFTEVLAENAFTELQSAWNPSLHLGFNYRGKSINPRQYRAQRECFQFVKQDERRLLEFEDRLAPPSIRGLHKAIGNRNATGHLRKRPAGGR